MKGIGSPRFELLHDVCTNFRHFKDLFAFSPFTVYDSKVSKNEVTDPCDWLKRDRRLFYGHSGTDP